MDYSPEQIKAARQELAKRELARRQSMASQNEQQPLQEEQGIGSIPNDIADAGVNFALGAGNKAMQIPGEIQEAANQFVEHPFKAPPRAAQGVLSGLMEGAKGLYNLPLNLNTYLGSKGIFPFKQTAGLAEKLKIGDTGLQHAVMGDPQSGDQLWQDIGAIAPVIAAPETVAAKIPAMTSKGIIGQISKAKAAQLATAKKDYSSLFESAAKQGITHANPTRTVMMHADNIVKNSQPKFHTSLKRYIDNPTIENAHWAQSELGGLERHLDKISSKIGLTPSQIKTYKAVNEARKSIKNSMFNKNAMGKNPGLALKYSELSDKYKANVIPYTRLEELSETEAGRMRPKTAVKGLLNDEQFMIDLAKKNPGIFMHTPFANKLKWGALGLMGYDELKKMMHHL
jgi:hypothetical protein